MMDPTNTRWSATSPGVARYIWILWVIWLVFLWYPLNALFSVHPGPIHLAVVLAAAALFAGTYIWNIIHALEQLRTGGRAYSPWPALALLAAIALALTLGDRWAWIELFIFVTVSLGPSLPPRQALTGVGLMVLLAPVLGLAVGAGITVIGQMMFQSAVSGIAVVIVGRTIVLDRELRLAREEIARLAVNEERLRFARDLHDLLGHSLSLIALKSELAAKLAPAAPDRAAAEMRDVESAAREALHEVREAVAGYRQPTLAGELQNAREVLAAAGIECELRGEIGRMSGTREAALAWAVREGVTNVIKHSRATRCTILLNRKGDYASLEVRDDGRGGASSASGSGLAGLVERVTALGGWSDAGPGTAGGFHLTVALPLTEKSGAARSA